MSIRINIFCSFFFIFCLFLHYDGNACFRQTAHLEDYAHSGDDVTNILQLLINEYNTVVIDEGVWLLSSGVRLRSGVTIMGCESGKSIIKRNGQAPLKGGFLFFTEAINPDKYLERNPNDGYDRNSIAYNNIHLKNITVDFNRDSLRYTDKELKTHNIYGVALIKANNCSIISCSFIDHMNKQCNNGYPAIVAYQSSFIDVSRNFSNRVSFIKVINSKRVTISNNQCYNSICTAIETSWGSHHIIKDNNINGVYWPVSCVGINSDYCFIGGNIIYGGAHNISSITLGHNGCYTSASYTTVRENELYSTANRNILIQNGHSILIEKNKCYCTILPSSPDLSSGCITASGEQNSIYGLQILYNDLTAEGEGSCGCITYRGSGLVKISGNRIHSRRGISVLSTVGCKAIITKNCISSDMYSIQANCEVLQVIKNELADGIISTSSNIEIVDNVIDCKNHVSFLGNKWKRVKVYSNVLTTDNDHMKDYAFLFDITDKPSKTIANSFSIKYNQLSEPFIRELFYLSGSSKDVN